MNEPARPETHGYISSLAAEPHALTPPGPAPPRWSELRAVLRWALSSWRRAADAEAARHQEHGS